MTSFLLQKTGGQKVMLPSAYSFFGYGDGEQTTPTMFVLMRADGDYVRPVGQFEDQALAERVVDLLNRNGLTSAPLESLPSLEDQ